MKRSAALCIFTIVFAGYAQADEKVGTVLSPVIQNAAISTNSFEECAAVTMWTFAGKNINELVENAKDKDQPDSTAKLANDKKWHGMEIGPGTIKIPKGWSVVGTSISSSGPLLFICR
jgi:uncharacterized protein YbdZ (MbtH family)